MEGLLNAFTGSHLKFNNFIAIIIQRTMLYTQRRSQIAEMTPSGQDIINEFKQNLRISAPMAPQFRPPTYVLKNNQSTNSIKKSSQKDAKTSFSKRDLTPTFSQATLQEDYSNEIELSLLGENNNLKDHNNFLVAQIKILFKREKTYKKQLAASQARIQNLESINVSLQNQLKKISQSVMSEIERLQGLIETQAAERNDQCFVDTVDGKGVSWETQSSVYQNLEELKSKMEILLSKKEDNTDYAGDFRSDSRLDSKKMLQDEQFRVQCQKLQLWSSNEFMPRKGHQSQQTLPKPRSSLNPESAKLRGRQ